MLLDILGIINFNEITFRQLENTILKSVIGQYLLFTNNIFFNYFFYCTCIFQVRIIDGTLCPAHIATNYMLNFTEMLLLLPTEYYQLVLCEVSRLYVKTCLRTIPEKLKFV